MNRRTALQCFVAMGAVVLGLLLLALSGAPARAYVEGDDYVTNQVVVKLDPTSGTNIDQINADYGSTTLKKLLGSAGIYLLKLPASSDTETVADQMADDPRLLYAEPNFIAQPPEGDGRHKAMGISDTGSPSTQYAYNALNLSCARKISRGKGVTVAVLDTGAQLGHPALKSSFENVKRYDFVDDDYNPSDRPVGLDENGNGIKDEMVGHGTHVAGIVHLVAPGAKIMPLRVLDTEGYGNVFLIAEAVSYAERNGADVINMSLGSTGQSDLLQDVISDATDRGVVVVAAAGNENTAVAQYPAAGDGVVAVTSVDKYERKSGFASYGGWVDIAAPGNSIRSTFPISKYAYWSGTSMASPFVAGEAALIHRVDPSLDPAGIEDLIERRARPLDARNPAYSGMLGAGEANVGASLKELRPGVCS